MKGEVIHELSEPFDYAHKGEQRTASFITLSAPTSRNLTECAQLKQAFFRALPKAQPGSANEEPDDADDNLDGEGVMMLITMSQDVELPVVLCIARELLSSGVALVEGEEKLTKPLIDKMSQDDLESMTGAYIANFILASALQKLRSK